MDNRSPAPVPVRSFGGLTRFARARVVLGTVFLFSAAIFLAASDCNPERASELFSVTIENSGSVALRDYPVAIALDRTNFVFDRGEEDGSEVGVWNPLTGKPLPHWLESYDPKAGKGLLWIKLSFLPVQSALHLG